MIIIESSLQFKKQIESNIKKGNRKLDMFIKIRSCMDSRTALIVYKSMIMPYIEFSNLLLLGCNSHEKIKNQRIQNKGLKIAMGRDRFHSTISLHKECGIASWEVRSLTALNRLRFKYKFHEDFVLHISIATRAYDGTLLKLDRPYSEHFVESVAYRARRVE